MASSEPTAFRPFLTTAALLIAAGCSNTAAPGSDGEAVEGMGFLVVTMQQSNEAGLSSAETGEGSENAMSIDLDNVASLTVQVTSIQFLPATADDAQENENENDGGPWIVLDLAEPLILDLMALPTEAESPLVIAADNVEAGDYRKVRFLVGGASVVFNQAFSVGQTTFDEEPQEHPVTIPSGEPTGLKTDLEFTVADGGPQDINLLFDPDATFHNATATGSGKVVVAPVIH